MLKLFLVVCLISVVSFCQAAPRHRDEDWDYLLLSQFWPPTSCIYFRHTGCIIPDNVSNWTIHGLWPSRTTGSQPENCDKSMEFNYTEIQSLRKRLDVDWPYFNQSGERTYLWQHEWDKHGTCAYTLPSLQGEMNYFSKAMDVYQSLDIYGVLKQEGIVPSKEKSYSPNDIFEALVNHFQYKPNIVCFYNSENKTYHIEEIYLCYNKDLSMQDCYPINSSTSSNSLKFFSEKDQMSDDLKSYFQDCPKNGSVFYLPISH